tara:strand:- start:693 stop:938 length:246 start_codon:yes stop_codon:yes gene_type:complete
VDLQEMAVTRLERKGQKNKARAKVRNANLKLVNKQVSVASPNKQDSGVVIGDINDILNKNSTASKIETNQTETAEKQNNEG